MMGQYKANSLRGEDRIKFEKLLAAVVTATPTERIEIAMKIFDLGDECGYFRRCELEDPHEQDRS